MTGKRLPSPTLNRSPTRAQIRYYQPILPADSLNRLFAQNESTHERHRLFGL
jgi:hypothetical protein